MSRQYSKRRTVVHSYQIEVPIAPAQKGSFAGFWSDREQRVVFRGMNKRTHQFQADVGQWAQVAIAKARAVRLWPGRVELTLEFTLPAPAKKGVAVHERPPDVDKLCRAIFDGLKGIAYLDDRQVCKATIDKEYADATRAIGVMITVDLVDEP